MREWYIASDYGKRNNMNQNSTHKGEMIKRAINIPDLLGYVACG